MKKKAFTLIELLVVITIIALLVSILMPALTKAKEQAKITLCANNLKQQSLATQMYAQANKGSVPIFKGSINEAWIWDLPFETTRQMKKLSGIKTNEIFICPSNFERELDDPRWWQYTLHNTEPEPVMTDEETLTPQQRKDNIRVMPYIYTFDKLNDDGSSKLPATLGEGTDANGVSKVRDSYWIRNLDRVKMGGSKPMIIDATIEQNSDRGRFFDVTGGGMVYLKDSSNHRARGTGEKGPKPAGANHAYADGHVSWVQFVEMEFQTAFGNRFWWKY